MNHKSHERYEIHETPFLNFVYFDRFVHFVVKVS